VVLNRLVKAVIHVKRKEVKLWYEKFTQLMQQNHPALKKHQVIAFFLLKMRLITSCMIWLLVIHQHYSQGYEASMLCVR
jgi:hypothetical protein